MSSVPSHPLVEQVIACARKNLKDSECLAPVFFIGDEKNVGIFPANFSTDEEKDKSAMVVRAVVKKVNADFVLFVAESWAHSCKDEAEWEEMRRVHGPSLRNWPTAKEIVMLRLETPASVWGGLADILPGREMGEVQWTQHKREDERGRFTNFFEQEERVH